MTEIVLLFSECNYCAHVDERYMARGHPRSSFAPERLKKLPPISDDERSQILNETKLLEKA